jgi:hypothetical protein
MVRRSSVIRWTLVAAWVAAVAGVAMALYRQDSFFAVESRPVAKIEKRRGTVLRRAEGLVRWLETRDGEGVQDGDRVATGKASSTAVGFGFGRMLVLGEESQVQITGIRDATGQFAYVINLVRGTIVAEVKGSCRACPPLVVRAGEDSYTITVGRRVGVHKPIDAKAKKFTAPRGPLLAVRALAPPWLPQPVLPPDSDDAATEDDHVEPTSQPEVAVSNASARGFEVASRAPAAGATLWTVKPLANLDASAIDLPIAPPAKKPAGANWRPAIGLSAPGAKGAPKDRLLGGAQDLTIRMPLGRFRRVAASKQRGALRELAVVVSGGAQVTKGQQKIESYGGASTTLRIMTFGESPGGPVSLGFDRLQVAPDDGPWMSSKTEESLATLPIVVRLALAQDYGAMLPLVRGASRVGSGAGGPSGADGVFVVRRDAVVAQLSGGGVDAGVSRTMLDVLGADFVFRGSRAALYDARSKTKSATVDWVDAALTQGKVLYILKRDKLYPVSREFIKTNADVARFIDGQARAVFLEKVDILAWR